MDLYNYLYDNSRPTWEHNMSISGGNEIVKYKLSGNYFDQDGVIRIHQDNFTKYTMNSSIEAQIKPWLKISNSIRYCKSKYN